LEDNVSDQGALNIWARQFTTAHFLPPAKNMRALTYAGIDVVSFAGNHTMNWGDEGFLGTLENLEQNRIGVVGVGRNITEARTPAILERNGIKVAFLGYNSILPPGYWAGAATPGCAPMRISTFYEQREYQPGSPAKVITVANSEDLEAMKRDVRNAKSMADVVVFSIHWGLHFVRAKLAMYEDEVGHAAIDAGADLVVGHHPHILKAVEFYKGKAIFHSLGNFAFDIALPESPRLKALGEFLDWRPLEHPEWEGYPFPEDCRKTMIAKYVTDGRGRERVSFLPALINRQAQPEAMRADDDRFQEVLKYVEDITREAGFSTGFSVEGEEVVVLPPAG
jgi:poly-gamma-glutamate synthesis protein (capsule biosynthesis protein)